LPYRRYNYYDVILFDFLLQNYKEKLFMSATALEKENLQPALTVLTEEEELFRQSVREFAEGEVRPRVEEMEKAGKLDEELIKQCFELGLMAIESPEEYGGAGSTIFNAILAIEELARVDASVSVFVDVHNTLVTNAFMKWGSDELKKKYLPQMAEGRVGAYALSEAGSGSDAFALKTRAAEKDDQWEINGQKLWITNGWQRYGDILLQLELSQPYGRRLKYIRLH
jgi:alkylation response protein AidB-like acyl-CoA dehydrogenase